MRKSDCKPGISVDINTSIWVPRSSDAYYNTYRLRLDDPSGIITKYRTIETIGLRYHYTIEFGKRKKIYQTECKIGVMLTTGDLVYVFPNEMTRRQP